jgi:hypothetical protein
MSDGLTEAMRGLSMNTSPQKPKSTNQIVSKDLEYTPNQKLHRYYSFIKSAIRISGYMIIPFDLTIAAIVLIGSEIVGIIEELV